MNQMPKSKIHMKSIILTSTLLLIQASLAWAVEDITGVWEMTMEFGGRPSYAILTISKKADGALAGQWGTEELSNVTCEGGKIAFVRTVRFGDQEFAMNYNGVLKDGKIEGILSSDRGEFAVNGARKKATLPVLGQWDVHFKVGEYDITGRLSVSQKADGSLEGTWGIEEGEHVISNVWFKDGKLTFDRKSKVNDLEFETAFEGSIRGDTITGTFKNDMGQWPTQGQRVGTALIGEWELTSASDMGTRKGMMRIESDLTGRYQFFGGEIPMNELKLDGNQVTFYLDAGYGDRTFRLDFKGELDGKNLKGEMSSDRGTSQITGRKKTSASSIIGTWEFKRETRGGTRVSTLKINEDMTGTYAFQNSRVTISDLVVEGNQVSFKIAVTVNERDFRMDFKGNLDGDILKGVFTTARGSREATGKRVD
ncbi:MAG: hypothetical protein JXM79_02655 [Sedimentisphaerales bacterium]|nr:hypothetical protein [Sedimentisphaerales bacterium]